MDDALRRIRAAGRISGTVTSPDQLDHHLDLGVQFLYVHLTSLLAPTARDLVSRISAAR
jgi:2-keto-3-deoxy-L-rhamnonate aldolase RhmA